MLSKKKTRFPKKRPIKLLEYILNIIDTDSMTRYFVAICFAVSVLSTFINIALDLPPSFTYITVGFSFFYGILLLICKNNSSSRLCKPLIILSVFSAINIVWFTNGGSLGPTVIIFQAILPIFLFIIKIKNKGLIVVLAWLNICALFIIELIYPETIVGYSNMTFRFYDVFIVFIIFLLIEIPILYLIKEHLINEKEKAKRSEKIISSFLANMSHEIRTPMHAIIGFSDILMDDNIDKSTQNLYQNLIKDNGNKLLRIINNMVEASKLESNSINVHKKSFLIKSTFDRLRQKHLSQIPVNKTVTIGYKLQKENILIESDESIIFQILSNLIYNAVKYTEKGHVEYGLIEEENNFRLYVSDDGKGISEEAKKRVFDRFSIDETIHINTNDGVGLGLAICNGLTTLLNGKIELDSSPEKGSTFYIVLDKE